MNASDLKRCQSAVKALTEKLGRIPTAAVITFGCQMNARDSEKLSAVLETAGFLLVATEDADFCLYNTCTVRDNANTKLYGRLGAIKAKKTACKHKKIALCGCLTQDPEGLNVILKKYPFVDLIFGTFNLVEFPRYLADLYESGGRIVDIWEKESADADLLPALRDYPFKSGVNIMYGCDNYCSYCIVPYVRGRERSRSLTSICEEIQRLADDGVIEIMLLGQNVNSYGRTLEEPVTFTDLLQKVCEIDKIRRVRFMTSHPKDMSDELIDFIADSDKMCKQFHLPLQSGSSRILSLMNRGYDKEGYLTLALKIREKLPLAAITTDIITGFPTENDEDVSDTVDVINQVKFDNAYTFIYSKRSGTTAANMEGQLSRQQALAHFNIVGEAIKGASEYRHSLGVGKVALTLVEEVGDDGMCKGRIDSHDVVHFRGNHDLIGKLVDVKLTESKGFYYLGELI